MFTIPLGPWDLSFGFQTNPSIGIHLSVRFSNDPIPSFDLEVQGILPVMLVLRIEKMR